MEMEAQDMLLPEPGSERIETILDWLRGLKPGSHDPDETDPEGE